MTHATVTPKAKFKHGDTVMRRPISIIKFPALPKGELEVVKPIWRTDLPLLGPGTNRWFYECRPRDGGPTVVIQEKYLKQA